MGNRTNRKKGKAMSTLINLVRDLANGGITVVDLTETLREDYPVISLPCLLYTSDAADDL
mgnify:CR=1 FL=1